MSVNSISQDLTPLKIHPLPNATPAAKTVNVNPSINGQASPNQTVQSSQSSSVESLQKNAAISHQNKLTTDATGSVQKKQDRSMSHVVETYNEQGELLLKFMDSNNNFLYQIPSEMEVQMKELMNNNESSTSTTG